MANPIVHFEILAAPGGAKALQEFYSKAFDWTFAPMDMGNGQTYGAVDEDTAAGGIGGAVDESADGSARVVIYLSVDDPQAALERAKQHGAEVVQDVLTIPGVVTFAQFRDPAGNVVGIVASAPPA